MRGWDERTAWSLERRETPAEVTPMEEVLKLERIECARNLTFATDETSFETCDFFNEPNVYGSPIVAVDIFRELPESTQAIIDGIVRDRLLRPGALDSMLRTAQGDSGFSDQSICRFEDSLLITRGLETRYPGKLEAGATIASSAIDCAIDGVIFRRIIKDRLPIKGRLTPHQLEVAVALAYLALDGDPRDFRAGMNRAVYIGDFVDAERTEQVGTVMRNQELWKMVLERPETAARISEYLLTRGPVGDLKKDAKPVIAYVNAELHNAVTIGWL
jgi:hypothetical protein